jgi:PHD/YefM family antitoxin component YafN of YafNO toxin-antitoxin module
VKLIHREEIIMIQLNPEFLKKNGKPEFVVLPYEEFVQLQELLADLEDLQDLRQAKTDEKDAPTVSLAEAKSMLNIL